MQLKLVDPPPERIEHLVTQMKWRLAEGHGEAMYEIGVADDGKLVGLSRKDLDASLKTLRIMGERLRADVSVIRERAVQRSVAPRSSASKARPSDRDRRRPSSRSDGRTRGNQADDDDDVGGFSFVLDLDTDDASGTGRSPTTTVTQIDDDDDDDGNGARFVAEVLVRKSAADDQHFLEVRVAIIGGADAGKSTLLGVLTHSELDNGRGKSRLNLLRHRHEIATGRTSSISHQIVGFDERGELLNYGSSSATTWEQICEASAKVITFLDLAGHPKYQKTTISGLTGHSPDYACLIIGANAGGVSEVPREHLGIAVALRVPVFIVITKTDVATPEDLSRTVTSLLRLLKSPGVRRLPMVVQNEDDLVVAVSSLMSSNVIPIFLTSSVTGENTNLLIKFMNLLPKPSEPSASVMSDSVEFSIEETYTVPSVGIVVGGMLLSGTLSAHSGRTATYYIGPDRGRFVPVKIGSIHRQRCPINHLSAGQAATCSLLFASGADADDRGDSDVEADIDADDRGRGGDVDGSTPPPGFKVRKGQVILSFLPTTPPDTWRKPKTTSASAPAPAASPLLRGLTPTAMGSSTASTGASAVAASAAASPDVAGAGASGGNAAATWEFEADLHVLSAGGGIGGLAPACTAVVHLGSVRQAARVLALRDADGRWISTPPAASPPGSPRLANAARPPSSASSSRRPSQSPRMRSRPAPTPPPPSSPQLTQLPVHPPPSPRATAAAGTPRKRPSVSFALPPPAASAHAAPSAPSAPSPSSP
ncbi:GTP binding protein, partial [Cladochytrium tenue]